MDNNLFHDRGLYHTETILLVCCANQWTGFDMMGTSVMKRLVLKCIGRGSVSHHKDFGLSPGGVIVLEQYNDVV